MNRGIVVTGGGHGIGKQISIDFIKAGDKVCFIDIDEKLSVLNEREVHEARYMRNENRK